ncbi:MAG TPA: CPBP family intramembrane glutamic endopeptidase [Ignavibacteriales bacterium]|nr:CPBP family intramembrane glutamic endopeptidase [Ignavibacteriales bacterium]
MDEKRFNTSGDGKEGMIPPHINPKVTPLFAAFFGLGAVFFLYQIVGGLLTLAIFGLDFEGANVNALRIMTSAGQIMFILLPALVLTKFIYEDVTYVIKFRPAPIAEIGLFVLGFLILTPAIQSFMYMQNYVLEKLAENISFVNSIKSALDGLDKSMESTYEMLLSSSSPLESVLVVIIVAVTPAICEEIFFRGYVQGSFEFTTGKLPAALYTAIIFSLYHFNPYGVIPLMALGLYFGFASYKTNSLLVPVILHFLNNFISVIAYMIYGKEEVLTSEAITPENLQMQAGIFVTSALIFMGFVYLLNYYYDKRKQTAP